MSRISTHVLDTTRGKPAAGIRVQLFQGETLIHTEATNADGRVPSVLPADFEMNAGIYKLVFNVAAYFPESFFPEVHILFEVKDPSANYHVPLLLSGYGYSTYRGS